MGKSRPKVNSKVALTFDKVAQLQPVVHQYEAWIGSFMYYATLWCTKMDIADEETDTFEITVPLQVKTLYDVVFDLHRSFSIGGGYKDVCATIVQLTWDHESLSVASRASKPKKPKKFSFKKECRCQAMLNRGMRQAGKSEIDVSLLDEIWTALHAEHAEPQAATEVEAEVHVQEMEQEEGRVDELYAHIIPDEHFEDDDDVDEAPPSGTAAGEQEEDQEIVSFINDADLFKINVEDMDEQEQKNLDAQRHKVEELDPSLAHDVVASTCEAVLQDEFEAAIDEFKLEVSRDDPGASTSSEFSDECVLQLAWNWSFEVSATVRALYFGSAPDRDTLTKRCISLVIRHDPALEGASLLQWIFWDDWRNFVGRQIKIEEGKIKYTGPQQSNKIPNLQADMAKRHVQFLVKNTSEHMVKAKEEMRQNANPSMSVLYNFLTAQMETEAGSGKCAACGLETSDPVELLMPYHIIRKQLPTYK